MRRLEKTAGAMRAARALLPEEVEQGMDDFLRLMTLQVGQGGVHDAGDGALLPRVGVAMAEEGLAALYMFEVEGRRVASTFCFEDEGETLIYNSGYDPQFA